ncbi:uncharacterized protein BJX67DRAFT_347544 [Aspergillus lucknowensis]|uniref:Uncharacterized protein n=1 Tax=Aspergillus lucknowensis TaxID=176173 RepID=A0ABR4LYF1_9EURO
MASENDLNGLDLPEFGFLPFDLYVMEKWNPTSPLSIVQQKKQLVEEWIKLGKYGRREYLGTIPFPEEIPSNVPQNLLTPRERAHDGQIERTLFIRTWYGDPSDPASQDKADDDYAHLVEVISSEYGEMGLMMDEFFIFDEEEEFSSSLLSTQSGDAEFSDGVAIPRPGCMPSYVLAALMHCPDQIEGTRIENLDDLPSAEEVEGQQTLLVLVADRKACEEGWVLHLAINHKGQVLPFRVRDGADWVSASYANWSDGQQLTENTENPEADTEMYMDHGGGGGGWD